MQVVGEAVQLGEGAVQLVEAAVQLVEKAVQVAGKAGHSLLPTTQVVGMFVKLVPNAGHAVAITGQLLEIADHRIWVAITLWQLSEIFFRPPIAL